MPRLARYILRRVAQGFVILAFVAVANFALLQCAPGDLVDVLAGEASVADAAYLAELRRKFGLDQSAPVQLAHYLGQVVRGDLGYSFRNNRTVASLILDRVPATLLLMVTSLLASIALAIVLGATAARYVNRWPDRVISVTALLAYATPVFWIGLMMIVLFSVKLQLLPSGGLLTLGRDLRGGAWIADLLGHLLLPCLTLSLFYVASFTRLMRASMLEVVRLDYIRTARAKGLSARRVITGHALRNAVLPLVTMAGVQAAAMMGGAVVVETVFAWPGIGRLAIEAILQRDFNLLMGILLVSSLLVIVVNLVVDLAYAALDPRIELA